MPDLSLGGYGWAARAGFDGGGCGAGSADVAVDFVPDELESKLEIFSLLDRMAPPKTILCTPSDALSITDLASCVYRPERCVAVRGELVGWCGFGGAVAVPGGGCGGYDAGGGGFSAGGLGWKCGRRRTRMCRC